MTLMSVKATNDEFRFGTQSLQVTTGDSGDNAVYSGAGVAAEVGSAYTFSAYVKTQAAIGDGDIRLQIVEGGTLTPVLAESVAIVDTSIADQQENGWQRISVSFVADRGSLRPVVRYTGATAGLIFWLDGMKFEKGGIASEWQQNIVSQGAVVDQLGIMVDASGGGIWRLLGAKINDLGDAIHDRYSVSLGDKGLVFGGDTEVFSPALGLLSIGGLIGSTIPVGAGILWFSDTPPTGWMLCQGQSLLRSTYATLFAIFGTTWGAIDGTHFTLPDLRQRFPLGKAAAGTGNTLAATGGAIDHPHTITHTHTTPNHAHTLSAHTHTLSAHTHTSAQHNHSHKHQLDYDSSGTATGWQSRAWSYGASHAMTRYVGTTANTGTMNYEYSDTDATNTTPAATGGPNTPNTAAPSSDTTDTSGGAAATGASSAANAGTNNPPFLVVNFAVKV